MINDGDDDGEGDGVGDDFAHAHMMCGRDEGHPGDHHDGDDDDPGEECHSTLEKL